MYNKKSRISAILAIVTALLLIGFMVMFWFMDYQTEGNDAGTNLGIAFLIILFMGYGMIIVYAGSIPAAIVSLIFGIMMLKQQDRDKLISYNKRLLIAMCILAPFVALGIYYVCDLFFMSAIGKFEGIYSFVTAGVYLACIVMQIVTMIILKNSPEKTVNVLEE